MTRARKCWAFVVKDFLTDTSYRLAFAGQLVFAFFMVAAFFFFAQMFDGVSIESLKPYGGEYFPFVLVGLAFSSYLDVSIQSFADTIRSAQVLGTLEALLITPTPAGQVVVFSSLYSFLATSARVVITLLFGVLVFGVDFSEANWLAAVVILGLTIAAFCTLGILSASVVLVFKRADPSSWLVQGLSYLLGGVYYPISVLPEWGQSIAHVLPITHSLEAMRLALLKSADFADVAGSIVSLVLFIVIAGPVSVGCFRLAMRRVRQDGSLSQF